MREIISNSMIAGITFCDTESAMSLLKQYMSRLFAWLIDEGKKLYRSAKQQEYSARQGGVETTLSPAGQEDKAREETDRPTACGCRMASVHEPQGRYLLVDEQSIEAIKAGKALEIFGDGVFG